MGAQHDASGTIGRYVLLAVIAVVVLFPIYTTVVAALKPGNRVLVNPLVPESLTLDVLARRVDRGSPRPLPRSTPSSSPSP